MKMGSLQNDYPDYENEYDNPEPENIRGKYMVPSQNG